MGVPHDHLKCPVPKQLCHRAQIHTGHHKSTGKRMAVAMPGSVVSKYYRKAPCRISATLWKGIRYRSHLHLILTLQEKMRQLNNLFCGAALTLETEEGRRFLGEEKWTRSLSLNGRV